MSISTVIAAVYRKLDNKPLKTDPEVYFEDKQGYQDVYVEYKGEFKNVIVQYADDKGGHYSFDMENTNMSEIAESLNIALNGTLMDKQLSYVFELLSTENTYVFRALSPEDMVNMKKEKIVYTPITAPKEI